MKASYVLLEQEYSSESLVDLERDVSEIHDFPKDKEYKKLVPDKHGFLAGTYRVSIVFIPDESDQVVS